MASRQELRALITLAGRIDPSLQSAMMRAAAENTRLSRSFQQSSQHASRLSDIIKGTFVGNVAANAFSQVTSRIWDMAAGSVKLASDLNEVQNVVDVTFGQNAGQITAWSKQALNAFGLSQLQAERFAGTMGAMLQSSGVANQDLVKMSENLTALAGDLGSFYTLDREDAFAKIRSGISGETEPLKEIGINMDIANLQAYALSEGIKTSYQQMDQATQTMLRYNYLLYRTTKQQGDFGNTFDSPANQMWLFNANMQQLSATIAQQALPYLNQWLQKANEWAQNTDVAQMTQRAAEIFSDLAGAIQWVIDNADWLVPTIITVVATIKLLEIINMVIGLMQAWRAITEGMTLAQIALNFAMDANPIGAIIAAIGLLIGVGIALWQNWDWIVGKAKELWEWLTKVTEPVRNFFSQGLATVGQSYEYGIPMYAGGGVADRPSIFGEAGPEMAIPLQRTPRSLGLLQYTASILGAGGGSVTNNSPIINVNVYPSSGDSKEIASMTKDAVLSVIEDFFSNKERVSFG